MIASLQGFTVAILVAHGFQYNEMEVPRQALLDAGATVHIVSPEKDTTQAWDWYVPKFLCDVPVDVDLKKADPADYDALMIPGGLTNNDDLRMNSVAISFVQAFAHKPIASICHGQWLLIDAQLARGKTLTSWPSIKEDLKNAGATWVDQEVVRDGLLVTSRMPEDMPAFNRVMIEVFAQAKKKIKIS